ncbi:MAG: ArnT family glycosyltransferase [Rhizomicrobium sp.]
MSQHGLATGVSTPLGSFASLSSSKAFLRTASPARQALALIIAFTLLRLVLMEVVGLGVDESYTLAISRVGVSLSYFDHPPLHIWLAHMAQMLFGNDRAARLPFVLLSGFTCWAMFGFASRLFGARAGLWSVLVMNLTIFFGLVSASWILPDGPLNLFLLLAAWAFTPIALGEGQSHASWGRWLVIGLTIGLAGLSKYHAVLFGLSLLGFIAATPRLRPLFRQPQPYLGLMTALVIFSPVLIWNAEHGWVSFAFQGDRAGFHGIQLAGPLGQIAGQALLLTPWIFVPAAYAVYRGLKDGGSGARLCLWLGGSIVGFFILLSLWSGTGMIHWTMPGWLLLLPVLGDFLARSAQSRSWPKRWAAASLALFLLASAGAAAASATGWLGAEFPRLFKNDPTLGSFEWYPLRDDLAARGLLSNPHLFVTTLDWVEGGKIAQALGGTLPVTVLSEYPHGFAFMPRPQPGDNSLIIARPEQITFALKRLHGYYAGIHRLAPITIGRDGREEIRLEVLYARDLLKPYPDPYVR